MTASSTPSSAGGMSASSAHSSRRGAIPPDRAAALERHVRDCASCAARLGREQTLSAGLRRLAEDTPMPAPQTRRVLRRFLQSMRSADSSASH